MTTRHAIAPSAARAGGSLDAVVTMVARWSWSSSGTLRKYTRALAWPQRERAACRGREARDTLPFMDNLSLTGARALAATAAITAAMAALTLAPGCGSTTLVPDDGGSDAGDAGHPTTVTTHPGAPPLP